MQKFVRIQSTVNIEVTPGALSIDMTNPDAHIADRFKVATGGATMMRVLIAQGTHYYPSIVKDWSAVKSLARDNILTIGEVVDATDEASAHEAYERLISGAKKFKDMAKATPVPKDAKESEKIHATNCMKVIDKILDAEETVGVN